jgi:hypothetical protein
MRPNKYAGQLQTMIEDIICTKAISITVKKLLMKYHQCG